MNNEKTITNTVSTPLYLQLEQKLKEDIDHGIFPASSKLPTESELSISYHVSRVTVRKALKLLEDQDYIERKVGKGTYVTEKKLQRSFTGNVRSFTQMCLETGLKATAKMVCIEIQPVDSKQQRLMQLSSDAQVIYIERIRYADDQPILIERDYFSEEFHFLFTENLEDNSLYALIREKKGIVFTHADRTIDLIFSNATEAHMLGIKPGYPLLRICSITENDSGDVITLSEQLCIGDKFKLKV